jgi:hypothetical protein
MEFDDPETDLKVRPRGRRGGKGQRSTTMTTDMLIDFLTEAIKNSEFLAGEGVANVERMGDRLVITTDDGKTFVVGVAEERP